MLELGLWGGLASMLLLLMPFQVEGLDRLERLLTLEQLQRWYSELSPHREHGTVSAQSQPHQLPQPTGTTPHNTTPQHTT